ncbi:MAG: ankyrin repeat domain-containing protein, partial [Phycisphaeraceae bacterium JB051]
MHQPPAHGLLSFPGLMVVCLLVQLLPPATTLAQDQNATLNQVITQHDQERVVQLLNEGIDPNSNAWQVHPLVLAIEQKQPQIAQHLLDHAAHLAKTTDGRPLVHMALQTGQTQLLKILLNAGYDPEIEDKQGRRLMHHAADIGDENTIKLLLLRLVRTQDADNNGQTPLDIARARGSPQIIKLLESAEKPNVDQPAKQKITTTEQLITAIGNAQDGDILELGEGEFTGPIFVRNKKLTLRGISESKTILIGGEQTLVIGVTQGAELTLANVSIKPQAPKQAGIIVQKAKLTMLRCTMSQTPDYGLYVSAGQARVINCGFEKTSKPAIVAFAKSQLWVETSFFHDINDAAIHVQDGAQLKLDACGFQKIAKTAVVAVRSQSVVGTLLSFTDCKESLIMQGSGELGYIRQSRFDKSGGVYLQDIDRAIIMDSTFNASQVGITVRGRSKHPAAITRNRIVCPERGGIYLTNTVANRPSGLIRANEILASPKLGVLLDGKIKASLVNNIILTPRMAISIQNGAHAILDGNLFLGDDAAVNFYKTNATQTTLRRESLLGSVRSGNQSPDRLTTTKQLQIIIQENPSLSQSAREVISSVTDEQQLDNAVQALRTQWRNVTERIQSLAQVKLLVIDAVGKTIARPFRVYDGRSADFGAVDILPAHITDAATIEDHLTKTDDPLIAHLLKTLSKPKDAPELLDHPDFTNKDPFASPTDNQSTNESELTLQQKLNLLVNGPTLYDQQAFKGISLSSGIKNLLSMIEPMDAKQRQSLQGRSLIRRVNRSLLETIFPAGLTRSGIIASSFDGSFTNVSPGKYWVVDQDDDNRARLVDIPQGQKTLVKFTNPQSIWLTFHVDDQTQTNCLVDLRSQAQCMQALADTYQAGYLMQAVGTRLPNVEPETIEQALAYARSHLNEAITQPTIPKDMPREESKKRWTAHYIQAEAIKRIFAAVGTTGDIDMIIRSLPSDGSMFVYDSWAELIALIEARLGRLESGKLKSLLSEASPAWQIAAARNFARHGLFVGNDILRNHLLTAESPWEAGAVIPSLFHDPSKPTREAVVSYIRRFKNGYKKTRPEHISWMTDACLYLMTYGNKQELQAVSDALLGIYEARKFAIVSENPLDIAQMLLDHEHN